MQILQLNKQVSVSAQIIVDDIAEIVAHEVELLVCNRLDHEDTGQTQYIDNRRAALVQGLETRLLAFSSYQISSEDRDRLIYLIQTQKKIHLDCGSGSRSRRAANKIACGGHDL